MTQQKKSFTFTQPDNASDADFEKMCNCMRAISETMSTMIRMKASGSCGVRICRSRRDQTFGAVRRIVEIDD